MNRRFLYLAILAFLGLSACNSGPSAPTSDDLTLQFAGSYCSEDGSVSLDLNTEGRYANRRMRRNPFGGKPLAESCEGSFSFVEGENSWKLVFNKSDKKSNPMLSSCQGEVEVWNAEAGYLVGDSIIVLQDLFDGTEVSNTNCGG